MLTLTTLSQHEGSVIIEAGFDVRFFAIPSSIITEILFLLGN